MRNIRLSRAIALALAIITSSVSLIADNVSRERATTVARNFFASEITLTTEGNPCSVATRCSDAPVYYIFNRNKGGFVIISGDDALPPVIAYSKSGTFSTSDIPSNLEWWLDAMEEQVRYNRSKGIKASGETAGKWERYEYATRGGDIEQEEGQKLIKTPHWNQLAPYNNYCFTPSGKQAVAGCGPVAMSIAMYVLKCPSKAVKASGDSTITFRWDQMLSNYKAAHTAEQEDAVARLIAENGRRTNAKYREDRTSVNTDEIETGLRNYMYEDGTPVFDPSLIDYSRMFYTSSDWVSKIKAEIDLGRTVLYGGYGNRGGHEFILDGYDKDNNIHINWGWDGSTDGFFNIYNIEFYSHQDAFFNLKPYEGGKRDFDIVLYSNNSVGLKSDATTFEVGVPFTLIVESIYNLTSIPFVGDVAPFHIDKEGKALEQIYEAVHFAKKPIQPDSGYGTDNPHWKCIINIEPEIGDRIALFWRLDESDSWHKMTFDTETPGFVGELPIYDQKTIEESTSIHFNPSNKMLTIKTKAGVAATLEGTSGNSISLSRTESQDDVTYTTDASSLKGKYTLRLVKKSEDVSININFEGK